MTCPVNPGGGRFKFLAYNIYETASHIIRGAHFGSHFLQIGEGRHYCLHAILWTTPASQRTTQATRHRRIEQLSIRNLIFCNEKRPPYEVEGGSDPLDETGAQIREATLYNVDGISPSITTDAHRLFPPSRRDRAGYFL